MDGGAAGPVSMLAHRGTQDQSYDSIKGGARWTRAFATEPVAPLGGAMTCGLAWEEARLGVPGLGGWKQGLF